MAKDGTPRLGDFGVAHIGRDVLQTHQPSANIATQHTDSNLTQVGTILGTIAYLSPEVCLGEAISTKTDIWAFGIMLYEMLHGKTPFERCFTSLHTRKFRSAWIWI